MLRSDGGQPLDAATRSFFEPRFKSNFEGVRIHADARAAQSARRIGAVAYTHGEHVVLDTGACGPHGPGRWSVLAHELTHVIQQRGPKRDEPASGAHEREAEHISRSLLSGRPIERPNVRTGPTIARQAAPPANLPIEEWPAWFKEQAKEKKEVEEIEQLKRDYPWLTWPVPSTAEAIKEPELDLYPNGVIFDGLRLFLRREGKTLVSTAAYSGHANISDETVKNEGPIPDGAYTLSPNIVMPTVRAFQNGGVQGALGIDKGFQRIEEPKVQVVWGSKRIAIEGVKYFKGKAPRSGFFIHGGTTGNTTSGCIKIQSEPFWTELLKFGGPVSLIVKKVNRPAAP
ncbi:DUF4157 domain-containing protein [Polyangium fumosum]|uniref:DUF4157 domain-containing protein n=1 Tax=Polyangium fumosum TaxID=889272 RepID=A0A4U1J813_9BACT|nr:DUF4157 domain-containing protein [Polyangium fumosum]TKD03352.1 DUF4157 domain-containing protein [Polyangium fumosum]